MKKTRVSLKEAVDKLGYHVDDLVMIPAKITSTYGTMSITLENCETDSNKLYHYKTYDSENIIVEVDQIKVVNGNKYTIVKNDMNYTVELFNSSHGIIYVTKGGHVDYLDDSWDVYPYIQLKVKKSNSNEEEII